MSPYRSAPSWTTISTLGSEPSNDSTDIAVFSTFYGSKSIEKHFTFDNSLTTSPDHKLSLNPQEFAKMVRQLELSDLSRGSSTRISFDAEAEAVKFARRSLVSTRKIPKNSIISQDMIDIKRPGTGILPKFYDKILGSKTIRDISEDEPITWEDLDLYDEKQ